MVNKNNWSVSFTRTIDESGLDMIYFGTQYVTNLVLFFSFSF